MAINELAGRSIYCQEHPEKRRLQPLYQAAGHLVQMYSSKAVLDIGCSDFVASAGLLHAGRTVFGIELSRSALQQARRYYPQAMLGMADLTNLPINDPAGTIDCVLALDVLEHLEEPETVSLLQSLREKLQNRPLTMVISMPIISFLAIPTWTEGLKALSKLGQPRTGLFDSSHRILTNRLGHKKLLDQAGFEVIREAYTTYQGVEDLTYPEKDTIESGLRRKRFGIKTWILRTMLPALLSSISKDGQDSARRSLLEYQGIYICLAKD